MANIALLGDFDKTSPKRNIRSRHDLNIVGTSFESLGVIVSEKTVLVNFYTFLYLFVTKMVLLVGGQVLGGLDAGYRLGYKKASKCENKIRNGKYGPKLSKSDLRMFLRCLARNLCSQVAG